MYREAPHQIELKVEHPKEERRKIKISKPLSPSKLNYNSQIEQKVIPVIRNISSRTIAQRLEQDQRDVKFHSKEDQIQYDLDQIKRVIHLSSFNQFPPDTDLYDSTENAAHELKSLIKVLEQDYSQHRWSIANSLFKAEKKLQLLHEEFRYNYRVNSYFEKLYKA